MRARIDATIKNLKYNLAFKLLSILVQFASRTVLVRMLGVEVLGVNGLFTSIMMVLSLADMGIGSVLTYTLYKPLADGDMHKVARLMNYYKKVYRGIAAVVLIAGVCIMPFLHFFIKDSTQAVGNIHFIFALYITNTVVSYLCIYKTLILTADQKGYVVTTIQQTCLVAGNILMMILLYLTKNFVLYLTLQILFSISGNIIASFYVDKLYPFLKDAGNNLRLAYKDKKQIKRDTIAMVFHKLGGVTVSGTDSILLSSFVGLAAVGIYSNYLMIINVVKGMLSEVFKSFTASIGNLSANGDSEKEYEIFKEVNLLNTMMNCFCFTAFVALLNPFIRLWLEDSFLFGMPIVLIISLQFLVDSARRPLLIYKDVKGIFYQDRMKPIAESVVNLAVSIVLMQYLGIAGVFLGTIVSMVGVDYWVEVRMVFKYGFNRSQREYWKTMLLHGLVIVLTCFLTYSASEWMIGNGSNLGSFVVRVIVCTVMAAGIPILAFHQTEEFKHLKKILFSKILRRGKSRGNE